MSLKILTIDGPGLVRGVTASRSGSSYDVQGDGFRGWYSSSQILSELDEDETTTLIPFTNEDTDDDYATNVVPEDDPHAEDGVTLPWDPSPTEEWDGELTQEPDGADISLEPTKSTEEGNFDEDPESSTQVFGRMSYIAWNDKNKTSGITESGHTVDVFHTPTTIEWAFSDRNGNEAHHDHHSASYGRGLSDRDYARAYARMEDDAQDLPRTASINKVALWREYENVIDGDKMLRQAAWRDVRAKASRLYKGGEVTVQFNTGREIRARVQGDNDTYDTQVHRKNAFGEGVTYWDCDCAWGKHAYLRQRTFVGRMCSHALATYWAMQARAVPESTHQRINDKTERHTLGSIKDEDPYSQSPESDYDPAEKYPGGENRKYDPGELTEDPWQDPSQNEHVRTDPKRAARNADGYFEDEYVPYVRRESKAAVQGGLMVWDDDLAKVMKQIYNQPSGTPGAAPGAPGDQSAAGVPGGLGVDPSQMGADPSGSPLSADPSASGGIDPSAPVDPSQGDPNGAGLPPASATPPFVRTTTGPTAPDPTGNSVLSNYPQRRVIRHQFAEYTDGDTDNDFEEWGEPNSEDAETFNTVQDLTEDNDPEKAFYDDFYGRSSANHMNPFAPAGPQWNEDTPGTDSIHDGMGNRAEFDTNYGDFGQYTPGLQTPENQPSAASSYDLALGPEKWNRGVDSPETAIKNEMEKKFPETGAPGRHRAFSSANHFDNSFDPASQWQDSNDGFAAQRLQTLKSPDGNNVGAVYHEPNDGEWNGVGADSNSLPPQYTQDAAQAEAEKMLPETGAPGRHRAFLEPDLRYYGENEFSGNQPSEQPSVTDPAPGMDINTPAVPESALPSVPRGQQSFSTYADGLVIPNDSNDTHITPYIPAAAAAFRAQRPQQKYVPKIFRTSPPQNREASFIDDDTSLNWLKEADNDASSDNSWQNNPDVAQDRDDDIDYSGGDEFYTDDQTTKESSLKDWFEDDGNSYANIKEAEAFNDDSDRIVQEFQRSAAAQSLMGRTGGRHFTFSEQQDLVDENPDSRAAQFGNLNLSNSFYEEA